MADCTTRIISGEDYGPDRLASAPYWPRRLGRVGGAAAATGSSYWMTFSVIDAPAPAELISIFTAAVAFMALYSTASPDLVVFSTPQPPDRSAFP
jgi:hypothetical protein